MTMFVPIYILVLIAIIIIFLFIGLILNPLGAVIVEIVFFFLRRGLSWNSFSIEKKRIKSKLHIKKK